jgi:hypothetical protein
MKKTIKVLMVMMMVMVMTVGCIDSGKKATAENTQARETNKILAEIAREIGMPDIVNFQQKKLMKMIFELNDKEDLICYAYIKSDYQGKFTFVGQCIGYGIPFSAQYTNPSKIIDPDSIPGQGYYNGEGTPVVISQADPNGLYMPTSSSATWLIMVDPKTKEMRPAYFEPEIVVSPYPFPAEMLTK